MQEAPVSLDFSRQMLQRDMSKNRLRNATGAIMAALRGYTDAKVAVEQARDERARIEAKIRLENRKSALDRELRYAELANAKQIADIEGEALVQSSQLKGEAAAKAKAEGDEAIAGIRAASADNATAAELKWRETGFAAELEGIKKTVEGEKFAAEMEKDWQQFVATQQKEADIYISDKSYQGKIAELSTEEFKARLNASTQEKLKEIDKKISQYKADKLLEGVEKKEAGETKRTGMEEKGATERTKLTEAGKTERVQGVEAARTERAKAKLLGNREIQAAELTFLREKLKSNIDLTLEGLASDERLKEMDLASVLQITDMQLKADLEELQLRGNTAELLAKIKEAGLSDRLTDELLSDESLLDMSLEGELDQVIKRLIIQGKNDLALELEKSRGRLREKYLDAMLEEKSYSGANPSYLPNDYSPNISGIERVERLDVGIDYALDNIVVQLRQAGVRIAEGFDAWRGMLEAGVKERLTNPAVTDPKEKRRDVVNYLTNALNSRIPDLQHKYEYRNLVARNLATLDEALGPDGELDTGWFERNTDTMARWFGLEASKDFTKAKQLMKTLTLDELLTREGRQSTDKDRNYISALFPKGQYTNELNRSLVEGMVTILNNAHANYFSTYMGERMQEYAGPLVKFEQPSIDSLRGSLEEVIGASSLQTIDQRWENGLQLGRSFDEQMKAFEDGFLSKWEGNKEDMVSYLTQKYQARYAEGIPAPVEEGVESAERGEIDSDVGPSFPYELKELYEELAPEDIGAIANNAHLLASGDLDAFRSELMTVGVDEGVINRVVEMWQERGGSSGAGEVPGEDRVDAGYGDAEESDETGAEEPGEEGEILEEETPTKEEEIQGPEVGREPFGLREAFETIQGVDFDTVNKHINVLLSGEANGVKEFRKRLAEEGMTPDEIDKVVNAVKQWMSAMMLEE